MESLVDGSPAQKAGIEVEDIIVELNGQKLASTDKQDLATRIAQMRVDEVVKLKIWRNEEVREITVTLEAYQ